MCLFPFNIEGGKMEEKENEKVSNANLWREYLSSFSRTVSSPDEAPDKFSKASAKVSSFMYDPYVQNNRVKKISGQIFSGEDRQQLEDAVTNPGDNEDVLKSYALRLNAANYPLYRKNRLPSDILTYHNYTIPLDSAMEAEKQKEDEILLSSWRECFRPSYQFRRITSQVGVLGKVAYYYRQSTTRVQNAKRDEIVDFAKNPKRVEAAFLQQLPVGWWKITGFTDKNFYRVSFNLMYFLQLGNSLEDFDDFFKEAYSHLIGKNDSLLFNYPSPLDLRRMGAKERKALDKSSITIGGQKYVLNNEASIDMANDFGYTNGNWFYWVELPADRCFVFSDQEATANAAPSTMGVFLQAKDLDSYAILQQQLSSLPLNSMVVGEIPFHDNNLTGNTNDDFRVTPETMLFFNDMFNRTSPTGTGVQGLPYKNLKLLQFDGVTNGSDIYLKATQQFLISTGLGSLFTLTEKPNEAQVKTAQILEARYADFIYEQFENFVSIVYRRLLGLNYRWEFHIFGDCFSDESRKVELKAGLSLGQSYLLPRYVAMEDYSMEGAIATMDYLKKERLYDKFILLPNSYTSTNKAGVGEEGRNENKIANKEEGESKDE